MKQNLNLRLELLFQPHTSIQVQMVCRLIEQQHERLDEEGSDGSRDAVISKTENFQ